MQDITVEEAEQILSARLRDYSTDKTPHEIITQEAVHKIYAQLYEKTARLDKDIQALLTDIDRHYGVSPEDYLLRVYTSEKEIEKGPKVTKEPEEVINMRIIREYLSQAKLKKAVQHIDRTIEDYSDIWKFERGAHILKPQDVPNKCENSMYHLLSSYQIYKENNDDVNTEADIIFDATINGTGNEDLSELYPAVKAIKNEAKSIDRDEAGPIVDLYFSAIKDIVAMFFEDVKYDKMLDFHSENLTTEDKDVVIASLNKLVLKSTIIINLSFSLFIRYS